MLSERVMVYVTCADAPEAHRIAHDLLQSKLIACANVLAPHTAIYRWQGETKQEAETAMILKTRSDLVLHVSERIRQLHSNEMPCVVALPIQSGNQAFLDWIGQETD